MALILSAKKKEMPNNYACAKKASARDQSIIHPYRSFFRRQSLPKNKQYWSLSAKCAEGGSLIPGTELHHLLESKVISSEQFHGVDFSESVYVSNTSYANANWHHGDIYNVMRRFVSDQNYFNPGVVNLDFTGEPKTCCPTFVNVLTLLESQGIENVMVIGNFALDYFHRKLTKQDALSAHNIVEELNKLSKFKKIYQNPDNRWTKPEACLMYKGTGQKSQTVMGTIVIAK